MYNKNDLKCKLLELYTDAIKHGKPALQTLQNSSKLKTYPIMQFIKELCF